MAIQHGSYFPTTWMTVAVALAALLVVVRVAAGPHYHAFAPRFPKGSAGPLTMFALFVLWNLSSVLWAADRATSLQEATRVLFYLLVLLLALGLVRDGADVRLFGAAYVLTVALCALGTVALLAASDSPERFFGSFKLSEPTGYYNANATLLVMPAVLGLHLASRLSTSATLRPALFTAGVLLLQTAVLTQSRGGFWALMGASLVYFCLVPGRPRSLLWWGAGFGLIVLTFSRLNAPQLDLQAGDLAALGPHMRTVAATMILTLVGSLALGGAMTAIDVRLPMPRWMVWVGRGAAVTAVGVGIVLLVGRFPALKDPPEALSAAWTQFKGHTSSTGEVRFLDLNGSYRYELWQVAARTFEDHPALGIGADNYVIEWLRTRPEAIDVVQPHNLYLRLLAELGVPGLAFFVAAVGWALGNLWYRATRGTRHTRVLAAGLTASLCVYLIHDAGEWVWNVPAVMVAFFMLLGTALVVGRSRAPAATGHEPQDDAGATAPARRITLPRTGLPLRPLDLAAGVAIVVLVFASPQMISLRLSDHAAVLVAQKQTAAAARQAGWAAKLNPFTSEPLEVLAEAAAADGDDARAMDLWADAARRQPSQWSVYLHWGDWLKSTGRDPSAAYSKAIELNPRAPQLE